MSFILNVKLSSQQKDVVEERKEAECFGCWNIRTNDIAVGLNGDPPACHTFNAEGMSYRQEEIIFQGASEVDVGLISVANTSVQHLYWMPARNVART